MTGSLRFNIAGVERSVNAGETVDIPPNVPHYFWNDNDDEAHAVQEFRPALTTEKFSKPTLRSPNQANSTTKAYRRIPSIWLFYCRSMIG
ncbi:MAG: hypothetical protein R3E39_16050 [Anaerolineae bacterium]